ncbi:hypothetical protein ACN6LA_005350, partial [Streptomyces sp. SAS_269]
MGMQAIGAQVISEPGRSRLTGRPVARALSPAPARLDSSPRAPAADNGISAPSEVVVTMPVWHLRDYHDDDLDQAIQIWDQS